jgi:hypothetical protein
MILKKKYLTWQKLIMLIFQKLHLSLMSTIKWIFIVLVLTQLKKFKSIFLEKMNLIGKNGGILFQIILTLLKVVMLLL